MCLSRSSICSVEFGSKVFAIFNLILTGSSTVAIFADIYCVARDISATNSHSKKSIFLDFFGFIVAQFAHSVIIMLTVMLIIFIVAFMFAVVLVTGVYKEKSTPLHAYWVYGLMVETTSLLALGYCFMTRQGDTIVLAAMLTACFIYGFILFMIKKTYDKFKTMDEQRKPESLRQCDHF